VIVFANNCIDFTAERARVAAAVHPQLRVTIVESTLPEHTAHVGSARKILMDAAAKRFQFAQRSGILATTDADTVVASDWIRRTYEEINGIDAVAGFVEIAPQDRQALLPSVQLLHDRESVFRKAWTEVESLIDPRPEDPPPRHGAFVGASLAVTVDCYIRAGGIPATPCLEDRAFLFALKRVDARIRHSLTVRVSTSGRKQSRVIGGFGTFLNYLHEQGSNGNSHLVRNPREILLDLERRALIRQIWEGSQTKDELVRMSLVCRAPASCLALIDRSRAFGAAYERIAALEAFCLADYPMVPVDEAIEVLLDAAASRKVARAS
jgi:hypothetical protein